MTEPTTEEQLTIEDLLGTVRGMMRFARIDGRALDLLEARIHALRAQRDEAVRLLRALALDAGAENPCALCSIYDGHFADCPLGPVGVFLSRLDEAN